jgi:thiol-disulfide isomerase/thioredoxin
MNTKLKSASALLSVCFGSHAIAADDEVLTIGSIAPSLDVEHWVQDNGGELSPVTKFEQDKVYIVEFWATWCGPCINSMPHLAETQTKYGYEKLRLISISDEELDTVTSFLEKPVRGQDEQTYDQLTSVYSLTTDPDRSVNTAYMRAAGQNGIPTAFIVGKSGIVEWIGHPMRMDEPLEQVLEDKWDRDAFGVAFKKEQAASLLMAKISRLLQSEDKDELKSAVALINEQLAELDADSPAAMRMRSMKIQALLGSEQSKEAAAMIEESIISAGDSVNEVMQASSMIMMLPPSFDMDIRKALVATAMKRIDGATEGIDANLMARVKMTVGQFYISCKETDKAIEVLEEAKSLSDDENLGKYVDSLIDVAKKANQDDSSTDKN